MAGDWIKWSHGFRRKPEVIASARALGVSTFEAATLWMELWEWADGLTVDGWIPNVTADGVDEVIGRPGFAAAAEAVGWLICQDGGVMLPNFTRHNGRSAKARSLAAERMRRMRQRGRDEEGTDAQAKG